MEAGAIKKTLKVLDLAVVVIDKALSVFIYNEFEKESSKSFNKFNGFNPSLKKENNQ
jgi:hypothetical protein